MRKTTVFTVYSVFIKSQNIAHETIHITLHHLDVMQIRRVLTFSLLAKHIC